jgi:tetratricopeptide (TPR) repeat protein
LAYLRNDQFDLAAADFTNLISLRPDREAFYNRGLALEGEGLHDRAIVDFTQSISRGHDFAEGYYARGRSYEKMGLLKEALLDYHRAFLIDPKLLAASNAINRLGETP